jgi:hemoglobin
LSDYGGRRHRCAQRQSRGAIVSLRNGEREIGLGQPLLAQAVFFYVVYDADDDNRYTAEVESTADRVLIPPEGAGGAAADRGMENDIRRHVGRPEYAASSYYDVLQWRRRTVIMGRVKTVFDAAGGEDGLRRLAEAWHRRVMTDEVVGHAFSHGFHHEHVERLAAYWGEALGGPTTYSDCYGNETAVVKMHSGHGKHDEMDRRAISCFDQALADVGLAKDDVLRQVLHDYFAWATTTTMSRYSDSADDVPNGLIIPHWSWDGLQSAKAHG